VLSRGDSGPEALALQQRLHRLGHRDAQGRPLAIDGRFGDRSHEAVQSFQRSAGLEADGVVGPNTAAALRVAQTQTQTQTLDSAPARLLMEGSTGADVRGLQQRLNRMGYGECGAIQVDGGFGPHTAQAVRQFQRANRLAVDGIVGPDTSDALQKAERTPLVSDAAHPDNAMYRQALESLGRLDLRCTGFRDDRDMANAAASIVFDARVSGLRQIDYVLLSSNGQGLFAVQGRLDDPAHNKVHVDRAQAIAQPIAQSTMQLAQEVQGPPVMRQEQEQRRGAMVV
jgi:peptidoglycan hydrolase-like protein with peptidoglycan-binding domain